MIPDSAPQMVQLFGKAMNLMTGHSMQRNMVLAQMKMSRTRCSAFPSSGLGFQRRNRTAHQRRLFRGPTEPAVEKLMLLLEKLAKQQSRLPRLSCAATASGVASRNGGNGRRRRSRRR